MIGGNYAGTTAQIGLGALRKVAIPQNQPNLGVLMGEAIGAYNKKKENEDLFNKQQAYADALKSGDQEAIKNAWIDLDAAGYADYANKQADAEAQRQFQREQQDRSLASQMRMFNMRQQSEADARNAENKRLQDALDRGLITQDEYNQAQRRDLLGLPAQPQINDNPFNKKRIEKAASEMDANITKAEEMKAVFEQADNALKNISTGGILAKLTKDKPLFSNADEEAFDSAAAKSIDMVRKAGTGPMTDADARRYERATIDRGKDKATNQLLIDSGKIAADNAIAKEELRAEWISRGGDIDKFDQEWRGYLNRNPIFAKDGGININRQDARDWFYNPEGRTYAEPKSAQPTQAQKMKGIFGKSNFSDMSDDDLLKGL